MAWKLGLYSGLFFGCKLVGFRERPTLEPFFASKHIAPAQRCPISSDGLGLHKPYPYVGNREERIPVVVPHTLHVLHSSP